MTVPLPCRCLPVPPPRNGLTYPAKYHGNAFVVSRFVTATREILHKWLSPSNIPGVKFTTLNIKQGTILELSDPDILWVAKRTSSLGSGAPLPY